MTGDRVVALVPMRHSSERVPGKNYRPFAGRPLYHWIVESLLGAPSIAEIVIDTDSPAIRDDAAQHFPTVRVIDRPEHLRGGDVPMNDVLLHDVSVVGAGAGAGADVYLQTHSTNPLLRSETIEDAVRRFFAGRPDHDSLFAVTRLQTRLWDADARPVNHDPSVLLRTQDLPPVFEENSNLYVFTGELLRSTGNRIGPRPLLYEMAADEAWDIDEELDFKVAEFLLREREREAAS